MRKQVLIVDSDPQSLTALREYLEQNGFEVHQAGTSAEALNVMRRPTPPQLVIADWQISDLDGLALCRALRAQPRLPFCYFILLTARRDQNQVMSALAAGADDFLNKPARPDEMAARIRLAQRIIDLEADVEALSAERQVAAGRLIPAHY